MTRVAATELHLGPPTPDRRAWGAPKTRQLAQVTVASFCIDNSPRARAAFQIWSGSDSIPPGHCDWRTEGHGNSAPVVCVDQPSAAAYCAQPAIAGHLPTIAEWEALMRSPSASLSKGGVLREWADDPSPPEIFKLRPDPCVGARCQQHIFHQPLLAATNPNPDGNALLAWYPQEEGNVWKDLGFRCAMDTPL